MIGHKWEPAEGTIISSSAERMELPGHHGMHFVAVYEIDVRTPDGTANRARVPSADHTSLDPGTIVRLEINSKTGELRLHPHESQLVIGFDASAAAVAAPPPAAGLASGSALTFGGPGVTVVNIGQLTGGSTPAGAHVHTLGGAEAAELLRTVMSGDPADQAAAREQLRHLRDEIIAESQQD